MYGELLKQPTWAANDYEVYGYRDKEKVEVDFVIEDRLGRVAGVEVKASASAQARDLTGLRKLAAVAGPSFVSGILLYDGIDSLPLGERLWAVLLCTLWESQRSSAGLESHMRTGSTCPSYEAPTRRPERSVGRAPRNPGPCAGRQGGHHE